MTELSWVLLIIPTAIGLLGVAIGPIGNLGSQVQSDRHADDRASRRSACSAFLLPGGRAGEAVASDSSPAVAGYAAARAELKQRGCAA